MHNATVLLVGPNKLSRESLRKLFDGSSFTVVAAVTDLRQIGLPSGVGVLPNDSLPNDSLVHDSAGPDIALVEVSNLDAALEALHCLAETCPDTPIVILFDTVCLETLVACLEAGASGFLTRHITRDVLLRSLELVVLGEIVFPTGLAGHLSLGPSERNRTLGGDDGCGLSCREVSVLQCLLNGEPNKVIANRLNITEATIKVHLKSVLRKIKATNRTQAAIWAYGPLFAGRGRRAGRSRARRLGPGPYGPDGILDGSSSTMQIKLK
jgi:two-component system nitrate/nitrite response regulator NarL